MQFIVLLDASSAILYFYMRNTKAKISEKNIEHMELTLDKKSQTASKMLLFRETLKIFF